MSEDIHEPRDDNGNLHYSPNGLCPLCGCECEDEFEAAFAEGFADDLYGRVQRCTCCEWESDVLYDVE